MSAAIAHTPVSSDYFCSFSAFIFSAFFFAAAAIFAFIFSSFSFLLLSSTNLRGTGNFTAFFFAQHFCRHVPSGEIG